jgi:NADPH-dependent 2,4-dienoyl-CoA reductase/sulfur reductase-like enzyme/nitrite reductase/ring-hydroxylating ferredoxin subunit
MNAMPSEQEFRVGQLADFAPDTMREVRAGDTPVLVVRRGDELNAFEPYCRHYGAPLVQGVLAGDRIVCPWHHACFDARRGTRLEPPALDGLRRHQLRVEGDDVFVTPAAGAAPDTAGRRGDDRRRFVICGGGAAGAEAAITLRREGFEGRIQLVTADREPPYDRTFLTKERLQGADLPAPFHLRPEAWWREHDVELLTSTRITAVEPRTRRIILDDGAVLSYDKALLATGARPRTLPVDGADLPEVVTLRTRTDMDALVALAREAERVVVVGASFIACEAAWSLRERGIPVALVAPEPLPFAALFGERVGRRLHDVHRELGIEFYGGRQVQAFEGTNRLRAVVLDDGRRVEGDVALVGIGVAPATDMLDDAYLDGSGGVRVDSRLRVDADLFAAGDIARFPLPHAEETARIEHWRLAAQHGALAARNMLGADAPYDAVPFFWSAQRIALYYVGHASSFDDIVYDGEPESGGPFIAYYIRDGRVLAALGHERNAAMAALEELLRRDASLAGDTVATFGFDPQRALERALAEA